MGVVEELWVIVPSLEEQSEISKHLTSKIEVLENIITKLSTKLVVPRVSSILNFISCHRKSQNQKGYGVSGKSTELSLRNISNKIY